MNSDLTSRTVPDEYASGCAGLLDEISRSTPLPAGATELTLIELNPHRALVFWNVDESQADTQRNLVLRVHDITASGSIDAAGQTYDVDVQGGQGRWYVDFWRDDRLFVAEIGYRKPDGSLDVLARSNEVHTPPAQANLPEDERVSDALDPRGRPVHTELPAMPESPPVDVTTVNLPAVEPVKLLDPDFPLTEWLETQLVASAAAEKASTADAAGESAVAFIDESEMQDALPQEFPGPEILAAIVTENESALDAFYEAVDALPPPAAAPESAVHGSRYEEAAPVSHDQPAVALEQVIGQSSLERAGHGGVHEVNVEIHIYGRAEPNSELTLYGQRIPVAADGTFSIRRKLPAGAMVIPLA